MKSDVFETTNTGWFFCCRNFWWLAKGGFCLKILLLSGKNLPIPLPPLPSEVPPKQSLSCVLLCSLTFSVSWFPLSPDFPGTNFPQKQQQSAANSMLISCFLFLLEPFPCTIIFSLCLKWPCGTFSPGKPYICIPYYFAVMILLQNLQWHKYRERIWAANPIIAWYSTYDLT